MNKATKPKAEVVKGAVGRCYLDCVAGMHQATAAESERITSGT